MYRNEAQVGDAVRKSGVPRGEVFVSTFVCFFARIGGEQPFDSPIFSDKDLRPGARLRKHEKGRPELAGQLWFRCAALPLLISCRASQRAHLFRLHRPLPDPQPAFGQGTPP
jgi:hypothetical protein